MSPFTTLSFRKVLRLFSRKLLLFLLALCCSAAYSQSIAQALATTATRVAILEQTITGQVTDENEEPLPGVNILVKGSTQGTVTDVEGSYRLTVPDDATTLVFS